MEAFAHLRSCLNLAEADLALAAKDGTACKVLLKRLAEISRPNDGGPRVLLVFARLATQACTWLDGDLRIEIVGDAEMTVVEVLSDLGAGLRERILPSFTMKVPLEEFSRTLERTPNVVQPLTLSLKTPRRLVLTVTEAVRRSSVPPSAVAIDRSSLYGVVVEEVPVRPQPAIDRFTVSPREANPRDLTRDAGPARPRLQRKTMTPDRASGAPDAFSMSPGPSSTRQRPLDLAPRVVPRVVPPAPPSEPILLDPEELSELEELPFDDDSPKK